MKVRHKAKEERACLDDERKKALTPYNTELNEIFVRGIPEDAPREKLFSISTEMKIHIDEALEKIKTWLERGYFLKRNLNVSYLVIYNEEDGEHLKSIINTETCLNGRIRCCDKS